MAKKRLKDIGDNIDRLMGVNQLFNIKNSNKDKDKIESTLNYDIKYFNLKLPRAMHKHIKKLSTDSDRSINDLLLEAINSYYKIKNI